MFICSEAAMRPERASLLLLQIELEDIQRSFYRRFACLLYVIRRGGVLDTRRARCNLTETFENINGEYSINSELVFFIL